MPSVWRMLRGMVTPAGTTYTRREFLGGTGAALTLSALAPGVVVGQDASTGSVARPPGRKIKLGLVGCGSRGAWMGDLFRQHGGYELWAVADYFQEVADECGNALGVDPHRRFSTLSGYRRVLESGIEAVALETPPYCFPAHVEAAVAAGLHVYMAKPIGCDVPGILAVETAARKAGAAGKVFLVDYQIPTDPENIRVVQMIREGGLGAVQFLDSHYYADDFDDPPFTETYESRLRWLTWVNDNAGGGGYHVNAGIHAVQAGLWVVGGRPISAMGVSRVSRPDPHGDSHDVFSITFECEDGTVWSHRGKHLRNRGDFDVAVVVHGQNGHAQLSYNSRATLRGAGQAHDGAVVNLYQAGAVRNIAKFHREVTTGQSRNETVAWAVDSALATILGREACARSIRLSMAELLHENRRQELDLRGLKT